MSCERMCEMVLLVLTTVELVITDGKYCIYDMTVIASSLVVFIVIIDLGHQ